MESNMKPTIIIWNRENATFYKTGISTTNQAWSMTVKFKTNHVSITVMYGPLHKHSELRLQYKKIPHWGSLETAFDMLLELIKQYEH